MLASHWLSAAINEFHGVPGKKERRTELRHRLIDIQAGISEEISVFSHEIDLTEIVDRAKSAVEGKGLLEKLFIFASLENSPQPEKLRQSAY